MYLTSGTFCDKLKENKRGSAVSAKTFYISGRQTVFQFYALPKTKVKLESSLKRIILLTGSFNGYWNFGDLLQLRGAIRWYEINYPEDLVCPFLHLKTIANHKDLELLNRLFATEYWLFYAHHEEIDANQQTEALGLEPLKVLNNQAQALLHVYGGGFFNRFWGHWMLSLIEQLLRLFSVTHYLISGQQVSPDFAGILAKHCQYYQPDLIGCRDPLSVQLLQTHGILASLSGDDAFEELLLYKAPQEAVTKSLVQAESFGLHLNLSGYVYSTRQGMIELSQEHALVQKLNNSFQLLLERFGSTAQPVIVGAYLDDRPELDDSWACIKKTLFTKYFPHFTALDLVGLLIQGKLSGAAITLQQLQLFVAMSYHTALFLKVLGVPTYLLAFNEYYQQKQQGIESCSRSLKDFLKTEPKQILAEQDAYLLSHRQARQSWQDSMREVLNKPDIKQNRMLQPIEYQKKIEESLPDKTIEQVNQNARIIELENWIIELEKDKAWLEEQWQNWQKEAEERGIQIKNLQDWVAELEKAKTWLEEQWHYWQKEAEQKAVKIPELESRVAELENNLKIIYESNSWRLTQKYWRLMDNPQLRTLLKPARKFFLRLLKNDKN